MAKSNHSVDAVLFAWLSFDFFFLQSRSVGKYLNVMVVAEQVY